MADSSPPGVGELSRQVREVLGRFEGLVNKLEAQFVTKEIFKLYTDQMTRELEHLIKGQDQQVAAEKERNDQLDKRIAKIESNITWIVRLVLAAVVVALLAGIGLSKAGGGG
jgi:hypothetical protein